MGLRGVSNRWHARLERGDGRQAAGNWHWGCGRGEEPPLASKKKRLAVIVQISDPRIPHIYSHVNRKLMGISVGDSLRRYRRDTRLRLSGRLYKWRALLAPAIVASDPLRKPRARRRGQNRHSLRKAATECGIPSFCDRILGSIRYWAQFGASIKWATRRENSPDCADTFSARKASDIVCGNDSRGSD